MAISTRVKHTGKPWRLHHITVAHKRAANRKRIELRVGKRLTLELSQRQAIELTNQIADIVETS